MPLPQLPQGLLLQRAEGGEEGGLPRKLGQAAQVVHEIGSEWGGGRAVCRVPFLRGDGIMCEMEPNQNSAVWRTKKGPKDQQKKATMTCQLGEIRQKFWKMRRSLCALPCQ